MQLGVQLLKICLMEMFTYLYPLRVMLTHVQRYLVYIFPVILSFILLDLDLFGVWDVVNGIYLFLHVKVSQDI